GPDGKIVQEVDSPNGTQGPEPVSSIVEQGGKYRLEVESLGKTAQPGKYRLKLEKVKTATEKDRAGVEIEKLQAKAEQLRKAGKYDQALPLAQQAVEQSEKIFGAESLPVATSLNNLGGLHYLKGDYTRAEPLHQRALAICEKVLGPDHLETAKSLNDLADIFRIKDDSARAELLYQRALAICEKALGPDHPDVAKGNGNLAALFLDKGNYARAEPLFQRSLAIREKALGPDHPDVALSLNNLAVLYYLKGDFEKTEPLLQRALAIREKALSPDHPDVADSLDTLAEVYKSEGQYAKAEPLSQRSLAIFEKVLGPDHPDVALSLNNLANLYQDKGDYAQAEPLYQRALAISEKALGSDHPDVAGSLNNLAVLYKAKGDFAKAEPLLQRALAISEKALGPNHPETAISLNNLANLYQDKGDFVQAEPLYQRALAISEKALGSDHPDVAGSLNNLAALYWNKADYPQAELFFKRSLAIREKTYGPDHPSVAISLNNLAVFYQVKGETVQAVQYRTRCNDTTERDLLRNLVSGSENQKALYLKKTGNQTDLSISLHVQEAPHDPVALQAALTVILRRKGRGLDAMTSVLETLRRQQTPETQKLLDDYASLAGQLSVLTLRGPGKKKPEDHLAYLKELEQQKEKLEVEFSAKSAEFKAQATPITLENVRNQIPSQASLVEYAVYRPYDAKTRTFGTPRYVAYVVKPGSGAGQGTGDRGQGTGGSSQKPVAKSQNQVLPPGPRTPDPGTLSFADLGEAEAIDQAVSAFQQVLKTPSKKLKTEVQPRSQALYKLVVKPIEALVGKTNHLLISPDGALNLIPFSALANERGQFLVERYTLTYLTSGRDLLGLNVKLGSEEPSLVMANPDYALGTGPVVAGQALKPLLPLPATGREGQEIQKLVGDARLVVKTEATEKAIKAVHRPALLHVATHGYFLTDTPRETPLDPTRSLSDTPAIKVEELRIENPLLRSWLFFAGANQGGNEDNDGIMTALEAAQLDLWGTKLVTLSACETGVGEAKTGDGVYGLRRALVLAGSEAQLMSLWSVSDQATRELMVDYYTRLKAGEGRS
ncbi:MAG TPA: CHAT domain-containing protein, partial [Acidobacteriota bacterium]|nr:CHAT domain-containing protein [Acidobacteriota bacterium]